MEALAVERLQLEAGHFAGGLGGGDVDEVGMQIDGDAVQRLERLAIDLAEPGRRAVLINAVGEQ